jgi:hypothetical protein
MLDRLKQMKFKIAPKINLLRAEAFVNETKHYETLIGTEIEVPPQEAE